MWDRLTEVFACYGAISALLLVFDFKRKSSDHAWDENFYVSASLGWAAITFVPGFFYIFLG